MVHYEISYADTPKWTKYMHVQGQTNDVKAYNKLTYVEDHEKSMHLDRGG